MAKNRDNAMSPSKEKLTAKTKLKDTVVTNKDITDDSLVGNNIIVVAMAEPEEFADSSSETRTPRKQRAHRRSQEMTCPEKTAICMKRFCLYLLSYVGLTCIVVAYSVLGGFVFVELEAHNEEVVQGKAVKLRNNFTAKLYDEVQASCQLKTKYRNVTGHCNISDAVNELLKEFQVQTYELVNKDGWAGNDDMEGKEHKKWTFSGALLYSVTVITTIGYGYVTPKTTAGQAVTMVYALIGIPLTVLCISKIGKAMAALFRALYGGTFCVDCRRQFFNTVKNRKPNTIANDSSIESDREEPGISANKKKKHSHENTEVPIIICLLLMVWYIIFGAILFTIWETDWTYFTGAYFCFITLSTIGFGDIVPGFSHKDWDDQVKQVACSLYLLIGLATLAMCFDLMQQSVIKIANRLGQCLGLKSTAS